MIERSSVEGLPGASESAGRRLAREMVEKKRAAPVRKSERLNNNLLEDATAQKRSERAEDKSSQTLLRRSERGKSQSPLKCNKKYDESCSISVAKVRSERVDAGKSEDAGAKRRKLYTTPFKSFKSLFGQSKTNCVSTEPSDKLTSRRTLAQSNCVVPETEAEDKHQSVSNPNENKLRKKSENLVKDSDIHDGITPKIQTKEVSNVVKEKPSEYNVDHEFPESKCKGNLVELDSSAGIESKIQSAGTLPDSDKDRPMQRDTEAHACVHKDSHVSPSHDNISSTQNIESGKVEVSDETRVMSKDEAATLKENSQHDVSANVSHNRNEVQNSSGRSASSSSPRSRRFVEYWVPAPLSNLQLEQYCAALLANSVSLCSSLKSDPVGAIRNLLITLRKVCNHPYLVDPDLSTSLLRNCEETENLDVGIIASGKLQLLEALLLEMKKRGLRVLILYEQSSIYARDKIGEILDDFLLQRYGQDSFEHVNVGATVPSKKQAALNRFNNKKLGRFLFLLEIRACASSIKLSSLDSIIIFNSDWNPINDIRALQKVILDSQHDQMNIIRLFSPLTVEENAMFLSKNNATVDNSMHNISHCHRDKLLIRGASALFHELEKFHLIADRFSSMISSLKSSLLQDVAQEFISIYLDSDRHMGDGLSIYLKVQHNGEGHGKFRLVADELDTLLTEESWPHNFWSKLLNSRCPQWKFVSDSSKRKRKIVNYNETEDVKKFRKVVHDSIDVTSTGKNQKVVTSDKGYKCAEDVCVLSELHNTASEPETLFEKSFRLNDTKKKLHLLLKPGLQKLCELLNLSEDVKKMAEQFLEYVVENHHVTREPVTLIQAFQISVCWIAASIRKQKISCHDSLTLARKRLNFCCSAEDTDYMYLKMLVLKELFIQSTMDDMPYNHASDTDTSEDSLVKLNLVTSDSKSPGVFDTEKLMVKIIRQINKKSRERMKLLMEKQRKELEELKKSSDAEKQQLERDYKVEVAVVRSIHIHNRSMASEKVKALEDQHSERLEGHRNNRSIRSKSLERKHSSEKDKENELISCWKEDIVKEQLELLQKLTRHNFENGKRKCYSNDQLCNLDSQKEYHMLQDQEILKSQPGTQADSIEDCQSTSPEEASALLPASSEAGNNFDVVDSAASASAKVLQENFATICSETGQVACAEAANFVDLGSEMEVPESSPVDVLPLKLKTSAMMNNRPIPEKTLDCQITSQQLSQSAVLIPDSGLFNPSMDVPLALSNGKAASVLHECEAPSLGHSVPRSPSTSALDNHVGNSSLDSSLGGDDVPPSQLNVEAQAVKGQPDILLSTLKSGFEQSDAHNKLVQSVIFTAKSVHQLPATEKPCELPSFTITTGSTQSQVNSQLLLTATDLSNVNPTAAESVAQPPAIEGQREFPSSTEAVHQVQATEPRLELPYSIVTPGCEQDHSDIQLNESLLQSTNHTFVESVTPGGEAVQLLPATDSIIASGLEQSQSGIDNVPSLPQIATINRSIDPLAAEESPQLSATEEALELPVANITVRSEQSDPDYQNNTLLCQTAINSSYAEPSTEEATNQLRHSPLVSASQRQSSLPVSEELPSGALGSTLNADAPNAYPSPSVVEVPCTSPGCIAITQSSPTSRPGATNAVSDFPTNLIPGTIAASIETVRVPNFSYLDPLQSELVSAQKEADHIVTECEEKKQVLNSECEKEIENMVAQIRKKYETQILELDAAMKYRKSELDVYRSKVYRNMILAEILRKKCSEPKVFVPPGIPQDNVQHQLLRQPPVIANASVAVQSLGNLQGMHSSAPLRHPALGSVSSATPIPGGPSAEALLNSVRAGGPSAAPSQSYSPNGGSAQSYLNLARSAGHSAALSQNSQRPGGFPVASSPSSLRYAGPSAVSSPNLRPTVPAVYSPSPMRRVTTGIPPATPLPRSSSASTSGLPSTNVSPLQRPMGTLSAVRQALQPPVQVLNRPITTTSIRSPTLNLHSASGVRARPPHLQSRISQPMPLSCATTTFSARIPGPPTHPTFSNVSLRAPTVASQLSSYHKPTVSMTNVSTLPMPHDTVLIGVPISQSQTAVGGSVLPTQTTESPPLSNNEGSKNQQLVCLSDSD